MVALIQGNGEIHDTQHVTFLGRGVAHQAAVVGPERFDEAENVKTYYAQKIKTGQMPDWEKRVVEALSEKVYITIDSDFFDPSILPSVGTPEPGGFSWYETIGFLRRLCAEKTVVGFDLCEFTPIEGMHHPDFTLARLIYKLIGYVWMRG